MIRVLYEDSRSGGAEFGPHVFVQACVADRVGLELYDPVIRGSIVDWPLRGVGNVVRVLREEAERRRSAQHVLALVDGDRASEHLGCPPTASDADLEAAALGARPPDVRLFVLRDNTESLVWAVARALGRAPPAAKSLDARDRLLLAATRQLGPIERGSVVAGFPGLDAMIAHIAARIAP